MPLTAEEKSLKKKIYQALADEALEPADERYVPIYQAMDKPDPLTRLHSHIELTDVESVQFFSGFRGSGKTTELLRLKQKLESEPYFVIYADALKYINPADEIDITDLLIVIGGAFSDALEAAENIRANIQGEGYWTRLKNFLSKTEVTLTELRGKVGVGFEGLAKSEASIKLNLQTTPTFRQQLQVRLKGHIGELRQDLVKFVEDGVKAVKSALGDEVRIVFIFDSLEQIRGSLFNEEAVIKSVERVFSLHHSLLELPYVHAIYTVPPWLKFVLPNHAKPIVLLHSVKQWENDGYRTTHKKGGGVFRELMKKRFGEEGFKTFFGTAWDADKTPADLLLDVCGGHFRDLLSLLRETVLPAQSFPVSESEIKTAIENVRSGFLPIAENDAAWLAKIETTRDVSLPDLQGANIGRLTRFLDTHLVLYFRNGKDWYDIHPLIREEVRRIVKRLEETITE
jgi:hypothetical protein